MMTNNKTLTQTFQTRVTLNQKDEFLLNQIAALLSRVSRRLHADLMNNKTPGSLKSSYIKSFGITARQFNACRVQLEGKIRSIKTLSNNRLKDLNERIATTEKKIKSLSKSSNKHKLYHKKKTLYRIASKRNKLKATLDSGRVSLCFGGGKLFNKQFFLENTNFSSHSEWKGEWQRKRDCEFFTLGSKDESGGNQTCTPFLEEDGTILLRLRLPDSLVNNGQKYLWIKGLNFEYGQKEIVSAIYESNRRSELQKEGNESYKEFGRAISFRFHCDEKGWRIFATVDIQAKKLESLRECGAIGVDINNDHLAIAEVDRFGNPINQWTIPLVLYGKSKNQAKALIGNACKQIIDLALASKKPIVIEKLDFQKKKKALKGSDVSFRRILSSLSYNQIIQGLESRGFKNGIEVIQVNPAYTSMIGRIKYAKDYGLTVHHAAAVCIARRMLKFSEKLPRQSLVPTGKGTHIAFSVPVRNRKKSSVSYFGEVYRKLKVTLVEYYRMAKSLSSDPPIRIFAS